MDGLRRSFLKLAGAMGTLAAATASGLVKSGQAWAAPWNKAGFESKTVAGALKSLGAAELAESKDIVISAPDIAENGALVAVTVTSRISATQQISIIVEKNPFPMAASFDIANGAEGYVSVRLKMSETSNVRAVVKAGGKFYTAAREVKVTIGGCG